MVWATKIDLRIMNGEHKISDILTSGISSRLKDKRIREERSDAKDLKEFKNILKNETEKRNDEQDVRFSLHATRRIEDRKLDIDGKEFVKLKEGINRLRNKGGRESLIVTGKAAYIVDVDKNKIVTAMDKNNLGENVFTKIDSTLFIN